MRLITFDVETYYDGDYSLRKLTTEEYIRDPRFEVIGFALKVDAKPAMWFSADFETLRAVLSRIPWDKVALVSHHSMFDAAILAWRFGFRPARYIDTEAMARGRVGLRTRCSLDALSQFFGTRTKKGDEVVRALGKRRTDFTPQELAAYGRYCCDDAELTYELLMEHLLAATPQDELRLIDWTVRCFAEPKLMLDQQVLEKELAAYCQRKETMLRAAGVEDISVLRSDARMAQALAALGVEPPTKLSPKQKNPDGSPKQVWAFSKQDVEFMDLLESDDEAVAALVEARLGLKSSILQSRIERFLSISRRGLLPVPLLYAGATPTRRWSGTDQINLQNLPRSKKGSPSPLRQAICAPPGYKLVAADLSQIELRANCWQSGQNDVLELLRTGGDTYADMATAVFGYPVHKDTHPNERFVGKTAVLGCGYQCGAAKFQHMLKVDSRRYGIPLEDQSLMFAERVVNTFREKNRAIRNFWYKAEEALTWLSSGLDGRLGPYIVKDHRLWLPNGDYLYYPDLRYLPKDDAGGIGCEWSYQRVRHGRVTREKLYGGKFVENITQAVARLFVSESLLRLDSMRYENGERIFHIVFSVHDELVMLVREDLDEDWLKQTVRWAMTTPPAWAQDIPLDCEIGVGKNYAEVK